MGLRLCVRRSDVNNVAPPRRLATNTPLKFLSLLPSVLPVLVLQFVVLVLQFWPPLPPLPPLCIRPCPYPPQVRTRRTFRYRLPVRGRIAAVLGQRLQ
ncbi:hypothetical protein Taro_018879 [Colocasia esculenta]|uniref:Uncharacterized protein n=1 Tax=Colocasia esculenta TaxID=4460 RepID=A0A843URW7_COLES|nr:hypothetical protein [Colocasia esculenta]